MAAVGKVEMSAKSPNWPVPAIAPSVHQHQGGVRAQPAQIDARGVERVGVAGVHARQGGLGIGAAAEVLGQGLERVGESAVAAAVHVLAADHHDWGGAVGDAAKVGPGHHHLGDPDRLSKATRRALPCAAGGQAWRLDAWRAERSHIGGRQRNSGRRRRIRRRRGAAAQHDGVGARRVRLEIGSGQQALQRLVGGIAPSKRRRATPGDQPGVIEHLVMQPLGVRLERPVQGPGLDVEGHGRGGRLGACECDRRCAREQDADAQQQKTSTAWATAVHQFPPARSRPAQVEGWAHTVRVRD